MDKQNVLARRVQRNASTKEQARTAYLMLIPALIILGIFVFYPIVSAGYLSLTSWDGFNPEKPFVGLSNYIRLAEDKEFWNSLLVTVIYAFGVSVLSVISGLFFALLLDAPLRGRGIYRTIYFLPVVTSSVAIAIVWKYMLDYSGLINTWLGKIGIAGPDWLQNRWLALLALTLLTVWKNLGFNIVLYLTALQSLPKAVFEASEIDGANKLKQVRFIVVPLLRPMTFFVIVQALINSFQAFDLVYVFTEGGPRGGTDVLGMMMYRQAFRLGDFGYGTAISLVTLVLVLLVTLVQWKLKGSDEK
ncbi:sugar ABC transporter permease [Varibaculum cambriense]|uniref:carbohydrate ABC transporter permease n=1 Tax=Varibaculum cambriense TaxID=184870 RepID=UPI002908E0FD|nr:sugar ABC transporter permease [Varibaculum cambriense]MDU3274525.1 sugar ABC transporter permease [Varibaculum cambriense]